jgi:hypothetical protein
MQCPKQNNRYFSKTLRKTQLFPDFNNPPLPVFLLSAVVLEFAFTQKLVVPVLYFFSGNHKADTGGNNHK